MFVIYEFRNVPYEKRLINLYLLSMSSEMSMIPLTLSLVGQILREGRVFQLVFLIILGVLSYIAYYYGKQGRVWEIRPLEGLEATWEGVGRAAEMGRPVMVLSGISGLGSSQTIAGLTVLGEVAQRAVEIGVDPHTTSSSTQVIAFSEAVIKSAYDAAGRGELYTPGENVRWFGGGQFAYAVGTAGYILEVKPAMIVFMGYFLFDVIVTMETGSRVGAQIIGGTLSALPEMSVFSDYLLIGEELYAASAMISQDKQVIATIAGQDWMKLIMVVLMVVGVILMLAGNEAVVDLMGM